VNAYSAWLCNRIEKAGSLGIGLVMRIRQSRGGAVRELPGVRWRGITLTYYTLYASFVRRTAQSGEYCTMLSVFSDKSGIEAQMRVSYFCDRNMLRISWRRK